MQIFQLRTLFDSENYEQNMMEFLGPQWMFDSCFMSVFIFFVSIALCHILLLQTHIFSALAKYLVHFLVIFWLFIEKKYVEKKK